MTSRKAAINLAVASIFGACWMWGSFIVADSTVGVQNGRTGPVVTQGGRTASKPRRRSKLFQPRIVPMPDPQFQAVSDSGNAKVHDLIVVTIRLQAGAGTARSAAFHLTTNPALLRYVGPRATGGGALLVQPSAVEGELIIYRSSVPEGFSQTESLADLNFEAISPGDATLLLTEARLFDASSRELKATYESGSLVIQ